MVPGCIPPSSLADFARWEHISLFFTLAGDRFNGRPLGLYCNASCNLSIRVFKTADGSEETYWLTDHAAQDAGRDTDDAAKKSAHVVVHYSEDAGHKIARSSSKGESEHAARRHAKVSAGWKSAWPLSSAELER